MNLSLPPPFFLVSMCSHLAFFLFFFSYGTSHASFVLFFFADVGGYSMRTVFLIYFLGKRFVQISASLDNCSHKKKDSTCVLVMQKTRHDLSLPFEQERRVLAQNGLLPAELTHDTFCSQDMSRSVSYHDIPWDSPTIRRSSVPQFYNQTTPVTSPIMETRPMFVHKGPVANHPSASGKHNRKSRKSMQPETQITVRVESGEYDGSHDKMSSTDTKNFSNATKTNTTLFSIAIILLLITTASGVLVFVKMYQITKILQHITMNNV